jgi:pimeloyl-ACP methyl ester carboxylesterase
MLSAMKKSARLLGKACTWFLAGIAPLLVVVVVIGNVYRIHGRSQLDTDFPRPGELVSVGTHRMHIHCVGQGLPTIVLDSGGYSFSSAWDAVVERAQSITRICAFDRAGLGWSERGQSVPTAESYAADLEALLAASGESGPYIFTGWSMGGGLTWLYTQAHLDEAAGIIMVDGMPRDMYRFVAMGADPTPRGLGRILSLVIDRAGLTAAVLALLAPGVDEASRRELPESTVALLDRSQFLSEGIVPAVFSVPSVVEAARAISPLGDLPLIVIARGMPGDFFDPLGDRKDEAETLWREMQTEMSTLSSDSRLWIAEQSDHGVPLRQPGIVVDAIRELVQRYRSSAGRPER